jgi:type III secretory pathway component EscU
MTNPTVESAIGFFLLSLLTWTVTFTVLVFGVMLRRKILLWDDQWKERIEERGQTVKQYAEDLQMTYEKIRSTYRLLGFFLIVIVALMVGVVYFAMMQKPLLGLPQTMSSLWLLALVTLSALLPAFVNFGVGAYVAETMLLKANAFVYMDVREEHKQRQAKLQFMEKAKQLKAQRESQRAAAAVEAATPAPARK